MLSWGTVYFSFLTLNDATCKVNQALINISEIYADYAIVAMMIERCVVVFFPLRAIALVNRRFTLILLCVCIIPCWISLVPINIFYFRLIPMIYFFSFTGKVCGLNPAIAYFSWTYSLVNYGIHVVASFILDVVLCVKLLVDRRHRNQLVIANKSSDKGRSSKENSAIVVMLLLSAIKIVLFLPNNGTVLFSYLVDVTSWSPDAFQAYIDIMWFTSTLTSVSHSINFLVYFCRIPSFRNKLVGLFSCIVSQ